MLIALKPPVVVELPQTGQVILHLLDQVRPMLLKSPPTYRSAAIAGAFAGITLVPLETWLDGAGHSLPLWQRNSIWLCALIALFALPIYFFVMGRQPILTSRLWFTDPEQRSRAFNFTKRGVVYMMGGLCGAWLLGIVTLTINYLGHRR